MGGLTHAEWVTIPRIQGQPQSLGSLIPSSLRRHTPSTNRERLFPSEPRGTVGTKGLPSQAALRNPPNKMGSGGRDLCAPDGIQTPDTEVTGNPKGLPASPQPHGGGKLALYWMHHSGTFWKSREWRCLQVLRHWTQGLSLCSVLYSGL